MASAPQPLGSRRDEFDVPPEVAYFNTANLAPLTHRVREAGARALERRARPWTIAARGLVHRRRAPARAVRAADRRRRATASRWSRRPATASRSPRRNLGLGAGDRIARARRGVPLRASTPGARRRARPEPRSSPSSASRGQRWTEAILAALDERVSVVSVPNVHWTDGALVDLDAVSERARALGCRLIDRRQPVGRRDAARRRPRCGPTT